MKVIQGKYDGEIVVVFSTENRSGFEVAGEMGLEGIPRGATRFVHVYVTDVQIEPELTNKILRRLPDDLILALIIEAAERENVGRDQLAMMRGRS